MIAAETRRGGGGGEELHVVGVGYEIVIQETDAVPVGKEMMPELQLHETGCIQCDGATVQMKEVGGYEGAALGDDAEGVVEVAEKGEELALSAVGSDQVVGKKESDAVQFVGGG